jgi:hypothetical protein
MVSLSRGALTNSGTSGAVALAEGSAGEPIFLPFLFRGTIPDSLFGIDLGAINASNGLNEMVSAGAQWVRRGGYLWPSVEPNKNDRNWSAVASIETELATATSHGLKTILVVQNAPAWALKNPGFPCGPIKAEEFASFANFMKDVVTRYSQPPYNVEYYEIFNEPDAPPGMAENQVFGCWGDVNDPQYFGGEYYGQMLQAVYPVVKAADPSAKVVLGGILLDCDPVNPPNDSSGNKKDCTLSRFLEGVLKSGAGSSFDVLSFHTYDYYVSGFPRQYGNPNWYSSWETTGPAVVNKLAYLRNLLGQYNVPEKEWIATEVALVCNDHCDGSYESTKAAFVVESYVYAAIEGLKGNIWYDVFGSWKNNGLLKNDLTPLPAYRAYKTVQNQIAAATFKREVKDFADVRVFEFDRGDRLVWVVWSLKLEDRSVNLPGQPLAVWDMEGNPLAKDTRLTVSNYPVFVELKK